MKKLLIIVAVIAALAISWSIGFVQGQGMPKNVIFISADTAKYTETVPGVSKTSLWGDDTKGPYGNFTKFAPGYDAKLHSHTNDIWITVHKGAYLYKDDAGEKRVGPGSFIFVPGGKQHWSGGDPKEGALFYEESAGKFDIIPAK